MSVLSLDCLPNLPQRATIARLAPRVWRDERIVALWIGGSIGRGAADRYSDVDLRIAVPPEDLDHWRSPDFTTLFDDEIAGQQFLRLGTDAFLHLLVLRDGVMLDFLAQSAARRPLPESVLMLGCRDDGFSRSLAEAGAKPEPPPARADGLALRQAIVDFWINSHKHRKVLNRGLDPMVPLGLQGERMTLLRLWYALATGDDTGPAVFQGIHGLSALVRAVVGVAGAEALSAFGAPMRDREEMIVAIERNRRIVSHVGRTLAERHDFDYPEDIERTVLQSWEEFRRET
jgi:hypothetical protein